MHITQGTQTKIPKFGGILKRKCEILQCKETSRLLHLDRLHLPWRRRRLRLRPHSRAPGDPAPPPAAEERQQRARLCQQRARLRLTRAEERACVQESPLACRERTPRPYSTCLPRH